MNEAKLEHVRLVDAIHAHCARTKTRCVLFIVGGGSLAIGWLLGRPGASSWLVEARIPYGMNAMRELFGGKVPGSVRHRPTVRKITRTDECKLLPQFCSEETSIELSRLACQRAQRLSEDSVANPREKIRFLGIGFTGALSSHQPKKGGSRCYLATSLEDGSSVVQSAKLDPLGRDEEERLTSEMILKAIADTLGVPTTLSLPSSTAIVTKVISTESHVDSLNDASNTHLLFTPADSHVIGLPNAAFRGLLFPGSFNPLHKGHLALAAAAKSRYPDLQLCFELSMNNVDKPALTGEEVMRRVNQFTDHGIIVTKSPRFFEKATILPGCMFVLGADTAVRLVDTKYYISEAEKVSILSKMIYHDQCRFLVGGRLDSKTNVFTTCEEEVRRALPTSLFELGFTFLDESEFRVDMSSTEIRQQIANGGTGKGSPSASD